ncbi:MAG: hypothetical protein WC829_02465 [Hyphomicrobium sp.]|jgi:hypothetical protein
MTEVLLRVLAVAFAAAAVVAVAVIARKMMRGPRLSTLFAPKPARRIAVIEQVAIDAKRKLVLVRRDNIEHLLMTGGPIDVVVETGIGATHRASDAKTSPSGSAHAPHPLGLAAE